MQKNTTYNTQLAKQLKERNCIAMDLLIEGLRYCNDHNHNLGEYILDKKWISVCEYAEIIQSIYEYVPSQMKFDKYVIIKELGRGGMGIVYLVVRENSTRILVLKTLLQCEGDHLKRFYKEARAASALQHPNIVPIYDFGQQKGIPYFTMRYIRGIDFEQFLKANHDNIDICIDILVTISQALHYIHEKNVIHRDIKPANILIDKDFNPYLADFGLVKLPGQASITKNGDILGTVHYSSPEQIQGLKNLSPKTDVYSLGILLYEVLTGKTPFADYNMISAYHKIVTSIPPGPQKYKPSIPDALNIICLRAMHKNPQKRYSALEFATALQQYKNVPNLSLHRKFLQRSKRLLLKGWLVTSSLVVIVMAMLLLGKQYYHPTQQWYSQYLSDSLEDIRRCEELLTQAKSLLQRNSFSEAYVLLQQAQKLDSDNIGVLYHCALCLQGQRKYSQAIEYLDKCIAMQPWKADYFKKRGEIYQKAMRYDDAIYDFLRSIELDPRNIFTVENIYDIALRGTAPRLLFIIKRIFTERSLLVYARPRIDLFQQQKNKLCAQIMTSKSFYYSQQPTTQAKIATFIDRFMQRDLQLKKSAYKALLLHPKISIEYIDTLLKTSSTKELIQLRKDLQTHLTQNRRIFILRTIVTYIQVQKKLDLRKLYSWKKDAFDILRQLIVSDKENEILRYYAAEIFFELDLIKAYQFTSEVLHGREDDLNLVYILKILARKYATKLQQFDSNFIKINRQILQVGDKHIDVQMGEELTHSQVMPFIKVQALNYVSSQNILHLLILPTQPEEVRLYTLAKLDINTSSKAYNVLSYFLGCDNEYQRGFALNLLSSEKPLYEPKLLDAMQDNSAFVRSVAISCVGDHCSQEIFNKLREHLKKEQDVFLRLQCVLSLSLGGHFLQEILSDTEENIILRFATMFYFSKRKKFPIKEAKVINRLLKDKNKIMRFFMTYSFMRRKFGSMAPIALSFIDSKDYYCRLGVATTTNPALISELRSYAFHDPEKQIRNVALISLVHIYTQKGFQRVENYVKETKSADFSNIEQFFPELNEIHRIYENKSEKEWLAFGYRHFLYRENYEINTIHSSMRDEFNSDHATYLQRLVDKIETEHILRVFRIDFLSFRAMLLEEANMHKLERSAVVYALFKRAPSPKRYQTCLDVLQSIDKQQPLQKYWLADLYLHHKEYAMAKKIIAEAIADEPWNVQFLKLRNQINKHNK